MTSSKYDISYAKYLFHQGKGTRCYEFLGARPLDGKEGFRFRLWAPNAQAVSVTGDFNGWDNSSLPMQRLEDDPEIWEEKNYPIR